MRDPLWLFAFSNCLFLSLALVKCVEELRTVGDLATHRSYCASDVANLQVFGPRKPCLLLEGQQDASEKGGGTRRIAR